MAAGGDPAFAVTLRVRAGADEPAKTLLGFVELTRALVAAMAAQQAPRRPAGAGCARA